MNQLFLRTSFLFVTSFLVGTLQSKAAVLSNNLDQAVSYTELVDPSTTIAASFGTGSQASTLSDVQMLIQLDGQVSPAVSLYSDQAGQPGSSIGSLSLLQPLTGQGLETALFSGQNLALSPNSTYWVVAQAASSSYEWAYTDSNLGSGSGFQHAWGVSLDNGAWFVSDIEPMMMSVEDSSVATPEPGSLLLLGLGGLAFGVFRRRLSVHPSAR
jgi:hypothetical protein